MRISDWSSDVCSSDLSSCRSWPNIAGFTRSTGPSCREPFASAAPMGGASIAIARLVSAYSTWATDGGGTWIAGNGEPGAEGGSGSGRSTSWGSTSADGRVGKGGDGPHQTRWGGSNT